MLVAEWYPRALRFARHMLGDARDAEEAVQDAWLRVHSAFPRFDEAQPFAPWFFRILANRCRTVGARIQRDPVVMLDDELPDIAAPEPTPPLEFPAHVSRALRQLPLEQREAFLLRHVEDHSYEAIAAAAGIGVSAARMRVKRAADTLRDLLQEALRA